MLRVLATELDGDSWPKHGLQWVRSVKSAGCSGLIIDGGLPPDALELTADLRFQVLKGSAYGIITRLVKDNERCLLCPCDFNFKGLDSFFAGEGIVCSKENDLSLSNIVMPIANIQKRVEAAKLLEDKVIPTYGCLLSSQFISGNWEAWSQLKGYFDFLFNSSVGFLEARAGIETIVLNLYAANFPGRVSLAV